MSDQMTDEEVAADINAAFTTAANEKRYTVLRCDVQKVRKWRFDPRTAGAGKSVLSEQWVVSAEVNGTNQFDKPRYRQIMESGTTTRQALASAIATLDTPW